VPWAQHSHSNENWGQQSLTIEALNHAVTICTLLLLAAAGFAADRWRYTAWLSGPACITLIGAVLAAAGLLPRQSPIYTGVSGILVPLAISLLLLHANFKRIFKLSGGVLLAFILGGITSVIGIAIAAFVVRPEPIQAMVGLTTAALLGGTANIMATGQTLGVQEGTVYTAFFAASAITIPVYFGILGILAQRASTKTPATSEEEVNVPSNHDVSAYDLAIAVAVGAAILLLSALICQALGSPSALLLAITLLSLIVGNIGVKWVDKLRGDLALGTLFIYIFFATMGASVDFTILGGQAAWLVPFAFLAIGIHLLLLLALAHVFRIDFISTLTASAAGVTGPPTAAAWATSRGRPDLASPAILSGLFGFAIATLVAVALAKAFGG
jgi:uncharacterized membrane protein